MGQPFGVDSREEAPEQVDIVRPDAVVFGVSGDRDVGDRCFPAERAVLPIEAQCIERTPVEVVPRLAGWLVVIRLGENDLVGIFFSQLCQPLVGARRAAQAVAEGASEFFASVSTNSASIWPTWLAHHSTALTTAR